MPILLYAAIYAAILFITSYGMEVNDILSRLNDLSISHEDKLNHIHNLDKMSTFEALKSSGKLFFFGDQNISPNYQKSFRKYEEAFKLSHQDEEVLFMLGLFHSYGIGCPLDIVKGTMFFRFAAKLGNAQAMSALGFAYRFGIGVEKNCSNSKVYYYKAAKRSLNLISAKDAISVRKPIRLTMKPVDSQSEAMEYYEYSAKTGDSSALLLLAQLYYFGTDVMEPDLGKARHFFEEATKYGNDAAYGFLGMIYYRGEGVTVDYERAKLYFSIASERNVATGINGLGLLYWHGHGVEKDLDAAEILFKRASDLKYAEAFFNHAMVLLEQSSLFTSEKIFQGILTASKAGYVHANLELVKRYLKSDSSCTAAVHSLRQTLEKGEILNISREAYRLFLNGFEDQALSRYIYLAAQGIEIANYNAAFILENSDNGKHSKRSLFFYGRSALLENSTAKMKIGNALFSGSNGISDFVAAASFYYSAARSQVPSAEAMYNLATDMYMATLNKEHSAYIAVNICLLRCYAKLWMTKLHKLLSGEPIIMKRIPLEKGEKNQDKLWFMFITLVFTCFIYWYMNFYQNQPIPPIHRQEQEQRGSESPSQTLAYSESENESESSNSSISKGSVD